MTAQEITLDESGSSTALRRIKQNPFLIVGIAGFFGTLAVGVYKYKQRPKNLGTAFFLVQLRVAAQGAVIGCLSIGMIYGMLSRHVFKTDEKPN
ncbi:HIG1 domain family member 1A, mitochondrial [Diachasma alloeum]|uniref:HIG1 domain family member 1A, mitochondrial n=1 Tax=Diachasma alloeum TaxID=454923 RepID=UPI000738263B|nr:HIG1 domain family member 1A, mitochondrial [Diachasma alloeum]XP_015112146.1 HIG1 domain family member 1A, mitochondrial [Diachasma alloeum]